MHRLDRDLRRGGAKEGRGNDRDQASGRRGRNLGGSENSGSQIQEGKKMSHSLRRKVFFYYNCFHAVSQTKVYLMQFYLLIFRMC